MEGKKMAYRPPMSDSEDDCYDGFYFDDYEVKPRVKCFEKSKEAILCDAAFDGDLDTLIKEIEEHDLDVDKPLLNTSLLIMACTGGQYDAVRYLLEERNANPNRPVNETTPLVAILENTNIDLETIEKIVRLLLRYGAVVNVSNKHGTTPFILACKYGYENLVKMWLEEVSFQAQDNTGRGPLFHAIENNQLEIVKILLGAGFKCDVRNKRGYTAREIAELHGFYDIIDLFPKKKEEYEVPDNFFYYTNLKEIIPQIFLNTDCPEYFQEIVALLSELRLETFIPIFAKNRIKFEDFLTMNDEDLKKLGIEMYAKRSIIRKAILSYHLCQWDKESLRPCPECENIYQVLGIIANHMLEIVKIKASCVYLKKNLEEGIMGQIDESQVQKFQKAIDQYRKTIEDLKNTLIYLSAFGPAQNPLFIDYDEFLKKKRYRKIKKILTYTSVLLGFSFVICLKFKKFF